MQITEFFNKHNIKWAYILLQEGSCPIYNTTCTPYNFNDFYENTNWIGNQELHLNERKQILNCYKKMDKYKESNPEKYKKVKNNNIYIAYALDDICVIDVDDNEKFNNQYKGLHSILVDTYQYKSRSKRYNHYIIKLKENIDHSRFIIRDDTGNNVADLLIRQSPWIRINEEVSGSKLSSISIDQLITDYKPKVNTSTIPIKPFVNDKKVNEDDIKEVEDLLKLIDPKYWDEYQSWINIGLSLKGLYGQLGYQLWDNYSMDSDKYDEDVCEKQWESFKINDDKVSHRSIARYAHKTDRLDYYKWVIKYDKGYKYLLENKKPFDEQFFRLLIHFCKSNFIYHWQFTPAEKQEKKQKEIYEKYFDKNIELLCCYLSQYIATIDSSNLMFVKHDYDEYGHICNPTIYRSENDLKGSFYMYSFFNKFISKKGINPYQLYSLYGEYKRGFQKYVYDPNKYYDYENGKYNKFNSWYGWKYTYEENFKVDLELIEPIIYHLKNIICNGNEELCQYILKIQNLILNGIKPEIALLVYGKKGSGKSKYFEWFGTNIVGMQAYSYINNINQLTARFNGTIVSKSYVVCDELDVWSKTGNTTNYEMMKSLITQQYIPYEKKGQDPIMMRDFNTFVMITNNFNSYPMGDKTNRRICAMEVSDAMVGNRTYFNKLHEVMQDDLVCKHYFHFVKSLSVEHSDIRVIPNTEYRTKLIAKATPDHMKFVIAYLYRAVMLNQEVTISTTDLYNEYVKWCEIQEIEAIHSKISFGRKLSYIEGLKDCKYRTMKGSQYRFTTEKLNELYRKLTDKHEVDDEYYYTDYVPNTIVQNKEPSCQNIIIENEESDFFTESDSDSDTDESIL